ncbi:MAG: hypothetical protein ACREKB_15330, partial [Candidatus Rokuibacteriota bacterium]
MSRAFHERTARIFGLVALGVLPIIVAGCGTGEKARREAEMAALVKQVEELKKGQVQVGKEVGRLAGNRMSGPAGLQGIAAEPPPPRAIVVGDRWD